jgi:hypothetical protein
MRTLVIYKPESDHAREVTDYLRDFQRQTGHSLEEVNPETHDGIDFCRVYDIVEYPSIIALRDDGQVLSVWRGRPLPTISEVSFYVA